MCNKKSNIMVTVICTAYNHEKFISDTLDGFLSQKTDFPVEYIIHDDASTDNTAKIISEYSALHPSFFTPIIQEENQYSKNRQFFYDIILSSKGKYIALCEGDDYWSDPLKLQRQVNLMETNPRAALCMHNAYILDILSNKFTPVNPYPHQGILSAKEVLSECGKLPPTASMLFRADVAKKMPMDIFKAPVGDRPLRMYLAISGETYYLNDIMSVYRTNNAESFSGGLNDYEKSEALVSEMEKFYNRFDEYTNFQYHDEVNMLNEMEHYSHYSRFNMIDKIRNNLFYIKKINKRHKIIVEIRGLFQLDFVIKIRKIRNRLSKFNPN